MRCKLTLHRVMYFFVAKTSIETIAILSIKSVINQLTTDCDHLEGAGVGEGMNK